MTIKGENCYQIKGRPSVLTASCAETDGSPFPVVMERVKVAAC